ncbi:MAG: MATE family efflux transporter [Treponema sp.]|nr:MATE family efflux transporter [Treponema sp.]
MPSSKTDRQLWALLVPLMVEQLLNSLMGVVDTVMVTTAGSAAISAVSLVDSINVLVINVFSAMATGGAILASQYIGNGNEKKASEAGKQLLLAVLVISVFVMAVFIFFRDGILRIIFGNVEEAVMANSRTYFFITTLSYPFIALYNSAAAIFRADKNSRLPMTISTISNFINIGGNAILIFAFGLGVKGAAISTLASRMFCAFVILIFLNMTRQKIRIGNYLSIRPNVPLILKILRIGVPTGIENGMFQFGKLAIQSTVSLLTTAQIAAHAMVSTLESLSCQAAVGIGLGMMTLVGQCIGAGDDERAVWYIKKLTLFGFFALLISSVVVCALVFPMTYFSRMEEEAAMLAVSLTIWVHVVKPFAWCGSFLPAYGLRAAGDVRFSMLVSMTTMWTCRVAIAMVLIRVFGFGPGGVWIAMASDWTIRSICFFVRFRSRKWLLHKIVK